MRNSAPKSIGSPGTITQPMQLTSSQRSWRWKPTARDLQALKFMISRPAAGLLLDPGAHKTSISLHAFDVLKRAGYSDLLIVIAKLRIVESTWPNEIKKWQLPFDFLLAHGSKRDELIKQHRRYDVILTNYESLDWLLKQLPLLRERKIMLVFDESSKLKDTRTMRFKLAKKLALSTPRRHILTGSPVPQTLMNIFGQTFVLDLGESFSPYITRFRNEFFMPTGYMGYEWVPQPDAEERIFNRLEPLMLRMPADNSDKPKIFIGGELDRFVELPTYAQKVYDDLEAAYIAEVKEGIITAANAAVRANKLRQVAGGIIYDAAGVAHELHKEKIENLIELIDELQGEPVLVAYEYASELAALQKQWPKAPHIGSGMRKGEMAQIDQDFNAGRIPVLFAHPQSAAHGLNLQESCRIVIWYTLTWSLENYEQFISRIWRSGQRRNVSVYRILARDTIDLDVVSTLDRKDRNQQRLLLALERRHEERQDKRVTLPTHNRGNQSRGKYAK